MLFIQTLLLSLPLSALAQIVLSPVPCTLVCIERSLSVTTCEKAQSGISDPSVVPCLCEDKMFIEQTVDCILNSGECRSAEDQQESFKYATGLCDSNGVKLPGDTPSDLPSALGITSTMEQSVFVGGPAAVTPQSSATPEVSVVDETLTTMITVPTSIACEPIHAVNVTYVLNNVTKTSMAEPTGGNCGNTTTTVPFTTTKRSTRTTTPEASAIVSSSPPLSTSTDASGAQGTTVQSGFMLALLGTLMWFV